MQHTDPDYSAAYVVLRTTTGAEGHGHTFTCGRGTELVCATVRAFGELLVRGRDTDVIFAHFGRFWHELVREQQLRWVCYLWSNLWLKYLVNVTVCYTSMFQFGSTRFISSIEYTYEYIRCTNT